jgi:CheY-like chemotaxis protein
LEPAGLGVSLAGRESAETGAPPNSNTTALAGGLSGEANELLLSDPGKARVHIAVERPLTILVVEDEWLVRQAIVDFLHAAGCVVIEATRGEDAVQSLQQRDGIDVVFTDIRLGGTLTGWDVGECSRETHPQIPVVYTSGAVITPARPVPGSVFLGKPYDANKVLNTCRSLHAKRRSQAEQAG